MKSGIGDELYVSVRQTHLSRMGVFKEHLPAQHLDSCASYKNVAKLVRRRQNPVEQTKTKTLSAPYKLSFKTSTQN